ncbi:D-alanyl-D-alanine carboxypeptidase family protein [Stakelama sediminis]|uniref:D-alanyl-D-alanine carboxypeptidase n=1 Tax=Stakelama sediminis TaxID=463200 RepID=A0A840YVB5_9SPHN|nr:M15 family metallopeptidase [Stakelama sediminis]MBB5717588.1 D-alanyl-D-alanine carboxypeptidase [Stakelama sediminis]
MYRVARPIALFFAAFALLVSGAQAFAADCTAKLSAPDADGRQLGHFTYPDTPKSVLVKAPEQLAPGGRCYVRKEMLPDLKRLLEAADKDPAIKGKIRAISCHRSIAVQKMLFCGRIGHDGASGVHERAWASAPPGHSEHATGYAIDFGTTEPGGCGHAVGCFGATKVGKWLYANATKYGFEMSFPAGNKQGVEWEPWHWRWVGSSIDEPGAESARRLFAKARAQFPANPAVGDAAATPSSDVDAPPPTVKS